MPLQSHPTLPLPLGPTVGEFLWISGFWDVRKDGCCNQKSDMSGCHSKTQSKHTPRMRIETWNGSLDMGVMDWQIQLAGALSQDRLGTVHCEILLVWTWNYAALAAPSFATGWPRTLVATCHLKGQPSARLVILLNSVWLGIDSTINSRALLFDAVGGPGGPGGPASCSRDQGASEPLIWGTMGYLSRLRALASSSLRTCCAWSLLWRPHRCGKLSFRFWSFWSYTWRHKGWGSKSLFSNTEIDFCLADYHPFRGLQVKVAGLQGQRDEFWGHSIWVGNIWQYWNVFEIHKPQIWIDLAGLWIGPFVFGRGYHGKTQTSIISCGDPSGHLGANLVQAQKSWTWRREDFWFVFDFLLAFFMVLETWVIAVAARQRSAEIGRGPTASAEKKPMPWGRNQVLMVTGEDLFLIDTSVLRRVFYGVFQAKNHGILLPCEGEVCKIVQNLISRYQQRSHNRPPHWIWCQSTSCHLFVTLW